MGYVIAALILALSFRSPRAFLAITVTFLIALYVLAQVEIHRVRVKLEQQEKHDVQQQAATAHRTNGRE